MWHFAKPLSFQNIKMFMNAFVTAFSLDIFYHIWYNKVKLKKQKIKRSENETTFFKWSV